MQKKEGFRFNLIKIDGENIILSKKGLSAIVATLIIILLTLVAVGVIWVVINNIVQRGAEQIELGQYTLDLQIKSAQIQNGDVTVVVIRRNPGPGKFVGMNFVFSDRQNSEIIREDTVLKELEEKRFTFRLTKISTADLKTVSVSPIFEMGPGKESIGNIADTFDVPANKSIGGQAGNFVALGFAGSGKVEYPGSTNKIPDFRNVIIDPLDVHVGDTQTFTAIIYSPHEITEVTTRTQLDNELLILPLELQPDGSYSASWKVYDTHTNVYRTTFIAKDSAGNENNITLTWTDPCAGLAHGSDSTLSVSCTVGVDQIDGLDTGRITLATGVTLTLNSGSKFAFTPGHSISLSSGASIRFNGSGSLTKQYLFYTDADGDNRSANSTYSIGTSPSLSGYVRAVNAVATSDCNESSSVVSVTRTQYTDSDNDGYNIGSSSFCASSSTWDNSACTTSGSDYAKDNTGACKRITTSGSDCYDANASAKPGQTNFFTAKRGSVNDSAGNNWDSFDYNCNGAQDKSDTGSYEDNCVMIIGISCSPCAHGTCGTSTFSTPACGGQYTAVTSCSYQIGTDCGTGCLVEGASCSQTTSSLTVSCN